MKNYFKAGLELMKSFFRSIKMAPKAAKPKKRIKRTAPNDIVHSPAEIITPTSRIVGVALRSLILFIGTFGLSTFVCDFFALTYNDVYWGGFYVSTGFVALAAFLISAVFGVASYSRKMALIAFPSGAALYLAVCAIMHGNPFEFIADSIVRLYNFSLYTMISRGYMYFAEYMINEPYDYTNAAYVVTDSLRVGGVILLTFAIGIFLGIGMMKKIRLWLLTPPVFIIMFPVMMFNFSKGTLGFVFTLAFIASCITVYVYDYRFAGGLEAKHEKQRKRLEKKEAKRAARLAKKEEKRALKEEADKMLMAALQADMGSKKSRLASKAVYKADKLARMNAKKTAKRRAKAEKKQAKLEAKAEKLENKKLKKAAVKGDDSAKAALDAKNKKKTDAKLSRKADKAEKKRIKKEKRHHSDLVSAAGGLMGIGAAVLAIIAVGIPALAVSKPFPKVTPVYNFVNIGNYYVTAYLSGNDIDLNDLSEYGISELTPRTLSFDPLEYEEIPVFTVSSTGANNVYLKGWVADSYDYYSDTWSGADHDKVLLYRQQFGYDFSPDQLSTSFKNNVYPSTTEISEAKVYKNFTKFGFTMQSVSVYRNSGYSRLMFLPYSIDTGHGLLERNSLDANSKKFSNYYEGIYSSRFFEAGDTYDTLSYVTRMNRDGIAEEMENAIAYYNHSVSTIKSINELGEPTQDVIDGYIYDYEMLLQENGIEYLGTSLVDRYFNTMTEEERIEFDATVEKELAYRKYAIENYSAPFESSKIRELAKELTAENQAQVITSRHDIILSVIEYLDENCQYTLTPDESLYLGAGSILDAFIFDVKQGYCSHFATAACAILREMGMPVRFVDGYIAAEFDEKYGGYSSTVLDSNAHAWIEVYYDGIGWVPYEVTPGYTEHMYDPDSATIEPVDPNQPTDPTPTPPPEDDKDKDDIIIEEEETELTEIQKFVIVLSSVAVLILLYFIGRILIKRFIRRGVNMLAARYDLIRRARDPEVWNDPRTDRHKMARRINDQIIDIFEVIGAAPEAGELSSVYAKRIASTYGDLSKINAEEIFALIQKEEFGHGLNFDETAMLAEYLADITASVYAGLNRFQKIKYRYIKRKI